MMDRVVDISQLSPREQLLEKTCHPKFVMTELLSQAEIGGYASEKGLAAGGRGKFWPREAWTKFIVDHTKLMDNSRTATPEQIQEVVQKMAEITEEKDREGFLI